MAGDPVGGRLGLKGRRDRAADRGRVHAAGSEYASFEALLEGRYHAWDLGEARLFVGERGAGVGARSGRDSGEAWPMSVRPPLDSTGWLARRLAVVSIVEGAMAFT